MAVMQGASAIVETDTLTVRVVNDLSELHPGAARLTSPDTAALSEPYFSRAWANVEGGDLHLVTIERGGELVALWPLYTSRGMVRQLGSGSNEEYGGILGSADETIAGLALEAALACGHTLQVFNLRLDDPLAAAIERRGRYHRTTVHSPIITVDGDANAWRASKSKSFRQTIKNARNRLAKQGETAIGPVEPTDAREFVWWLFDTKRQWLDANGIGASWIRRPQSEEFFAALLGDPASNVIGFALTLDGRYVAGSILLLSKNIEFFLVANDPAFAAYSPGQLVLDGLVDFAAATGANIDLRITQDPYKMRWADRTEARVSYLVARNWKGLVPVIRSRVNGRIRMMRTHVGRLRRSFRPAKGS